MSSARFRRSQAADDPATFAAFHLQTPLDLPLLVELLTSIEPYQG